MRYRSINQILFAVFLLTIGVGLLLINIGVISLEIKELIVVSYPFLIFALGASMLIGRIIRKNKGSLFISSFLLFFSTLLILDRFGYISFGFWDVWKLWPVLIILFALSLLLGKNKISVQFTDDISSDIYKDKKEDVTEAIKDFKNDRKKVRGLSIGDVSFKESNWALEPMELYNSIGDYYIDFSKAFIPEKETPVTVKGWIGDVKMIVPENIPVHIQTKINVGDIRIFDLKTDSVNRSLDYKTPGYDEAIRKLNITVDLKIGSIRIDKV